MKTIKQSWSRIFLAACLILLSMPVFAQAPQGGGQSGRNTGGSRLQIDNQSSSYGSASAGEAMLQYDPETGSLIVIADEETNAKIAEIIKQLDRPAPQVLINVVFLEVTHSADLDLGVEGEITLDSDDVTDIDTLSSVFGAPTEGAFVKILEHDWSATLHALGKDAQLEVLSRPSVLARNNTESLIVVGQEVPFITNSRITSEGDTLNTVEYEDIGIILRVTPYITPDGLVEMHVLPEISTMTGDSVPISENVSAPVFAKRSAETHVIIPDGKTVAIGGLMQDNNTESVSKIPILGDIPLIGALFRRTKTEKAKTELIIFLTPYVVNSTDLLEAMTEVEKDRTRLMHEVFSEEQLDRYINQKENTDMK